MRLDQFLAGVERQVLPAFSSFAVGVRAWREELLAYFDEPTTNGAARRGGGPGLGARLEEDRANTLQTNGAGRDATKRYGS